MPRRLSISLSAHLQRLDLAHLNGAQERQFSRQYVANYAAAQGIAWKARRDKDISNEQILEGVEKPTHIDLLRL